MYDDSSHTKGHLRIVTDEVSVVIPLLREEAAQMSLLPVAGAALPVVRVLTTDSNQRVHSIAANAFTVEGHTETNCCVTLMVDNRRCTLVLAAGMSAAASAEAMASRLPVNYRAVVDDATVTVWKSGETIELAA
ncbi:MAG: hypothetical protein K1X64_00975 [Myxococcaceae bacterium]|nr:hypothetical protein [Myxococcaceae bacterium]